jgi:hypothetical protein
MKEYELHGNLIIPIIFIAQFCNITCNEVILDKLGQFAVSYCASCLGMKTTQIIKCTVGGLMSVFLLSDLRFS